MKHKNMRLALKALCVVMALCIGAPAFAAPARADSDSGLIGSSSGVRVISQFMANGTGTHVVTAAALNVRTGPGTGYSISGRLHRGDRVQVVAITGDFCRIVAGNGDYGYVSRQYLSELSTPSTPAPTSPGVRQVYRVTASALNVRTGPGTSYSQLTKLYRDDEVYKLADANDTWMRIQLKDGRYAYAMSRYLKYSHSTGAQPTYTPRPTSQPTSRPTTAPTKPADIKGEIYIATANVNMRSGPSTSYGSKLVLKAGTHVTLISKYSDSWYYVRTAGGTYGYVRSTYLRYYGTDTSTPSPTSGIVNTGEKIYSFEQMKSDINALYQRYPNQVTSRIAIGNTMWSQQIPAVCIGNVNASKALLIDGGIHGREYMSTLLIMRQMEYLLDNQNATYKGRTIGSMLDECCIWFVPMINPDGVRISQTGLAGLSATQKNNLIAMNGGSTYFERWKANGYGVDLNRNFDAGWTYQGKPSGAQYSGSYANSESETQAMVNFVQRHTNIKASINYHTTGNCIYWHYGQTGTAKARDREIANQLSSITGFYLRAENYSGKGGGFMDWMIASRKLPSFTIELGPGSVNAPQDIGYFANIWAANRDVPAFMLYYIINEL